jgi:hypothetical protein
MLQGGGGLAVQVPRPLAIFGMVSCQPDFNQSLGFMDNPFQASIGPASYGEYVAAMTLNHALIYGVPLIHIGVAVVRSLLLGRSSFADAIVWVRFPSLSILPLLYWGSSVATASMVIAIYSFESWHRPVAVVSLILSFVPVGLMLWHLLRRWGATLIPGINPLSQTGRNHRRKEADTDETRLGTARSDPSMPVARVRLYTEIVEFFLEAGVIWKDQDGHTGYCRANRLLFMDYTQECYWFGVVEIGFAQVTGVLMGIKLGPNQCLGTLLTLIVLLAAFLVFVFWKRPYNSAFGSWFSVVNTFLQLLGACFLAGWMFSGTPSYLDLAEGASLLSLYLLIGKGVLDLVPLIHRIVSSVRDWMNKPHPTKATHEDLAHKLLEAVQDDTHLQLKDHTQVATSESANAQVDLQLPEQEEEEDEVLDEEAGNGVGDRDTLTIHSEVESDTNSEPLLLPPPPPPPERPRPRQRSLKRRHTLNPLDEPDLEEEEEEDEATLLKALPDPQSKIDLNREGQQNLEYFFDADDALVVPHWNGNDVI